MKKILYILLLSVLITACSEDSPFMPRDINNPADINFSIIPYEFSFNIPSSNVNSCKSIIYSTSPYVAGYQVDVSWDGVNWINYFQMNDYQDRKDGRLIYRVEENNITYYTSVATGGNNPSIGSASVTGQETRYSYTYPVIDMLVTENDGMENLYIERFYRVTGIDIYGRTTAQTIHSVKYCTVQVDFTSIGPRTFAARVIYDDAGINCTIRIEIPRYLLDEIWNQNQGNDNINQVYVWDLDNMSSGPWPINLPVDIQYSSGEDN